MVVRGFVREVGGGVRRMLPAPPMPVWVYEEDFAGGVGSARWVEVRILLESEVLACGCDCGGDIVTDVVVVSFSVGGGSD